MTSPHRGIHAGSRSPALSTLGLPGLLLALLAVASCTDSSSPVQLEDSGSVPPIENTSGNSKGKFIVTLEDRVDPAAVLRDYDLQPSEVYTNVFKGFAGSISEAARAGLLQDARIRRVVRDAPVWIEGSGTQAGAPWGLDRVDQRSNTLDGNYSYTATGAGVTAYIVDTGIRYTHSDFGGRASFGFDAFGGDGSDCLGHGTHVAGTVGGNTWGVAKTVDLVSVRVIGCDGLGSTSTVVAGLEWVLAHARRPAVVNLSLVADADDVIDEAVRNLVAAGIPAVVAAGNANDDACRYSPARVGEALTVGGTTIYDNRSAMSNYGSCVGWYAPGNSITSASHLTDNGSAGMSGTSMATAHTTGAAALFLEKHPSASPNTVGMGLSSLLTQGVVDTRAKGQARWSDLLYTVEGSATESTTYPPIADFAVNCTELTCQFTDRSTDTDGQIASRAWNFGGAGQSTASNPAFTFGAAGTYSVQLTVTDNDGLTGSASRSVQVTVAPQGIQLSAFGYKVKGAHRVDLVWSGATTSQVDVYRDGTRVAVVANTGTLTDAPGGKGNATYTYKVCQAGSSVCSPNVTATP